MDVSIVLPTLNEIGHIQESIPDIEKELDNNNLDGEIVIVDDSSFDGTIDVIKKYQNEFDNIKLIVRNEKSFGGALIEGYNASRGKVIVSMDADSINPRDIIRFINKINSGSDLVLGSRHSSDGYYDTSSLRARLKYIISTSGNTLIKYFFKLEVNDFTYNYRAIKRSEWILLEIKEKYSSILLEMVVLMSKRKKIVSEIPVYFKDRVYDKSKTNLIISSLRFIKKILFLYFNLYVFERK